MQPKNYARQARVQLGQDGQIKTAADDGALALLMNHDERYRAGAIGEEIGQAVKFMMPDGGRILGDRGLRAISGESVRLPFEKMTIEWDAGGKSFLMLAREVQCSSADRADEEVLVDAECLCFSREGSGAPWLAKFSLLPLDPETREYFYERDDELFWVLFDLLNALACSNVRAERLPARKPAKRAKGALPFDSYHYLTVDAPGRPSGQGAAIDDRRSPREHIRRGHIRRLADGRAIWINATMVNAGIGSRVDKSYVMRAIG